MKRRDKSFENKLAKPNDPDLDLDLDCVTIKAVVVVDREILVQFEGGFGRWFSEGKMSEVDAVLDGQITARIPDGSDKMFATLVGRLVEWRERQTPLRMCSARGRLTTLIEDRGKWIPLPRS